MDVSARYGMCGNHNTNVVVLNAYLVHLILPREEIVHTPFPYMMRSFS